MRISSIGEAVVEVQAMTRKMNGVRHIEAEPIADPEAQ
jgi:hypothetical protein